MPVYSMTGYASVQLSPAAASAEHSSATRLGLEIRSVNSRFLDLSFRLPEELRQLEPALRERITRQIRRGKVEVRAHFESTLSETVGAPSASTLQRLVALQDQIQSWLPSARALSVADVLRLSAASHAPATVDDGAF